MTIIKVQEDLSKVPGPTLVTRLAVLRRMVGAGLDYNKAKELSEPIIAEMNKRVEVIAKKYNKKPMKFHFKGFPNKNPLPMQAEGGAR